MIKNSIKEEVAEATRIFFEKGYSPSKDGGDLSIKDAETDLVYICPKPGKNVKITNWGVIRADDIVVIDMDGNIVSSDNHILPTIEYKMHLAIYKFRPEIKAIIHAHAANSGVFAIAGFDIPMLTAEMYQIGGSVVCAEFGKAGSDDLAQKMIVALGKDKRGALLKNHGTVALGTDMIDAFHCADLIEKSAKIAILANILGEPKEISCDDVFPR
ncbi:MAG: class II aldolase/adducin family protein [Pseudomonadota bacterium]